MYILRGESILLLALDMYYYLKCSRINKLRIFSRCRKRAYFHGLISKFGSGLGLLAHKFSANKSNLKSSYRYLKRLPHEILIFNS